MESASSSKSKWKQPPTSDANMRRTTIEFIGKIVIYLTTDGNESLNTKYLDRLYRIDLLFDSYLIPLYDATFRQLEESHAQIRYSALLLLNEFVRKSKPFRHYFLSDSENIIRFIAYAIEGQMNSKKRKKPKVLKLQPELIASQLKTKSVEMIHAWHFEFSKEGLLRSISWIMLYINKRLGIELGPLVNPGPVNEDPDTSSSTYNNMKLNILNSEVDTLEPEIQKTLTEIRTYFSLVVPKFEELESTGENEETQQNESHNHNTQTSSITFVFSRNQAIHVKKTEDNKVLVENLTENYKVITKYFIPKVKEWLDFDDLERRDPSLETRLQQLNLMLLHEKNRYEQLRITDDDIDHTSSDTDDSEFEDVDKTPEWLKIPCISKASTDIDNINTNMMVESGTARTESKLKTEMDNNHKGFDWHHPSKEMKIKTEIDPSIQKSKKGTKAFGEKYPNLIPINKKKQSTTRERLAKKLGLLRKSGAKRKQSDLGIDEELL